MAGCSVPPAQEIYFPFDPGPARYPDNEAMDRYVNALNATLAEVDQLRPKHAAGSADPEVMRFWNDSSYEVARVQARIANGERAGLYVETIIVFTDVWESNVTAGFENPPIEDLWDAWNQTGDEVNKTEQALASFPSSQERALAEMELAQAKSTRRNYGPDTFDRITPFEISGNLPFIAAHATLARNFLATTTPRPAPNERCVDQLFVMVERSVARDWKAVDDPSMLSFARDQFFPAAQILREEGRRQGELEVLLRAVPALHASVPRVGQAPVDNATFQAAWNASIAQADSMEQVMIYARSADPWEDAHRFKHDPMFPEEPGEHHGWMAMRAPHALAVIREAREKTYQGAPGCMDGVRAMLSADGFEVGE